MALSISNHKGKFFLKGRLNSSTSRFFIIHFEYLLSINDSVVINVDGLNEIDYDGITAFKTLKAIALNAFKKISVSSKNKNNIFNSFDYNNAA